MRCRLAAFALIPLLTTPTALEARGRTPQAAAAQPAVPQPAPAPVISNFDAEQTRQQLEQLMRQYPPSLWDVLKSDPSLLTNEHYLATYPVLASFLSEHPEISHNPAFFIGTYQGRNWQDETPQLVAMRAWQDMVQGFQIIS